LQDEIDQLRKAEVLEAEADMLALSGAFRQASDAMKRCNRIRSEVLGFSGDPNELRSLARITLAHTHLPHDGGKDG
jgi:hypothetical protein